MAKIKGTTVTLYEETIVGRDSLNAAIIERQPVEVEKAEEPEIKLPTSAGSLKKQESSRKTSFSALLTIPKP